MGLFFIQNGRLSHNTVSGAQRDRPNAHACHAEEPSRLRRHRGRQSTHHKPHRRYRQLWHNCARHQSKTPCKTPQHAKECDRRPQSRAPSTSLSDDANRCEMRPAPKTPQRTSRKSSHESRWPTTALQLRWNSSCLSPHFAANRNYSTASYKGASEARFAKGFKRGRYGPG